MTNGLRTPFGIIPIRVLREMLEPLRERENRILELENEVKRLKQQLNSWGYLISNIDNFSTGSTQRCYFPYGSRLWLPYTIYRGIMKGIIRGHQIGQFSRDAPPRWWKMNNEIKLEMTNKKPTTLHTVKVNGVSMTIFQHADGEVSMMIHTVDDKLSIEMCNVKVSKKTTYVHHDDGTKSTWADISIIEKLERN